MFKAISLAATAALALAVIATSQPALARDGGAIAAGVIGGLAVGAIIGSQANRGYYNGGPGYYERAINPPTATAAWNGSALSTITADIIRVAFASATDRKQTTSLNPLE
jgi:hypothetical protein